MLDVSIKTNLKGGELSRVAKAVPLAIRNSMNKSGAIQRRKVADRIGSITGEDRLTLLRTRVHHYPATASRLESDIIVLGPSGAKSYSRRRGSFELPVSSIRGTLPEPSLDEYVDGIMEEFEDLMAGHFLRYLGSLTGILD